MIVFGHTHQPYQKTVDGILFVNAGSVGKPKDLDWRARYVILDANVVAFHRGPYAKEERGDRATSYRTSAADIETGGALRADSIWPLLQKGSPGLTPPAPRQRGSVTI